MHKLQSTKPTSQEKLLFEGILDDFKIKKGRSVSAITRTLNDYYFDLMELFKLESLLVGKVLNNAQSVIIFDAVTKSGQKMDIHYHKGGISMITEFSPEMSKWRTAFLQLDKVRDKLYKDVFSAAPVKDSPAVDSGAGVATNERELTTKIEEAYAIASNALVQVYTA